MNEGKKDNDRMKSKKEQVTRGHNIVADGWAGASNLQPYPNHTPNPPPTHSYTNNSYCSIINTRFSFFNLSVTTSVTDEPTDQQTVKASYRVACPQLEIKMIMKSKQEARKKRASLSLAVSRWAPLIPLMKIEEIGASRFVGWLQRAPQTVSAS